MYDSSPNAEEFYDDAPTLRDYLSLLSRQRWLVLGGLLGVLGATLAYTFLQTPMYRASAEVLLRTSDSQSIFTSADGVDDALLRQASTERDFTESDLFRQQAEAAAGSDLEVDVSLKAVVSNDSRDDATTLEFTAEADDADDAATISSAWAQTYIEIRHQQDLTEFNAELTRVLDDLNGAQTKLTEVMAPVADLDARIAGSTDTTELTRLLRARTEALAAVANVADRLESDIDRFDERADELSDAQPMLERVDNSARVTSAAEVPDGPFTPNWPRNIALGLLLGSMVGVGSALLRESLDDKIRTEDDLNSLGLTTLGHVPALEDREGKKPIIHAFDRPDTPGADAFRSLVTSVQFLRSHRELKVIQLASAVPGEGKTTVAVNLAASLAQFGESVVIVDCDMRRPRVDDYFYTPNTVGLSSLLAGHAEATEVLVEAPSVGVRVIPSGPTPPNPSELLASGTFVSLVKDLRDVFQTVIIDGPPVLPVPDARVIAPAVDGIIIVVKAGESTSTDVESALGRLRPSGVPVLGAVLNQVSEQSGYAGYSDYASNPE